MKTIVCLGDSITDNTESESYVDKWQRLCDEQLGKGAFKIRSAGISGETAWDGLQRLDRDVLQHKPDLVTICFGHNEVHLDVPVTDYQHSLEMIISQIQALDAQVWLMTPTQIAVYEITEPDKRMPDRYVPYLAALKEIAEKRGCPLLDLWHVFEGHDLQKIFTYTADYDQLGIIDRDYLHPNQLGHEIIAKRLMDKLRKN